jgi:hypothetical protein
MPISGNYFVNQLAVLLEISVAHHPPNKALLSSERAAEISEETDTHRPSDTPGPTAPPGAADTRARVARRRPLRPDLVLSTSGGNVAAYIGSMGGWTENGIMRMTRTLTADIFSAPWLSKSFTALRFASYAFGLYKGTLMSRSSGEKCEALFESFSNSEHVQRTEIWTGTVNRTIGRATMFCNRSEKNSILAPQSDADVAADAANDTLFACTPRQYPRRRAVHRNRPRDVQRRRGDVRRPPRAHAQPA